MATDCSELKTCIAEDIADSDSSPAYKAWLEGSPTIDDSANADQCGTTRKFFGYDEKFLNDAAICAEIKELRYTNNFEHLNNFFGTDSPGAYGGAGSTASDYAAGFTPIEVVDLEVDPVEPPDIPAFVLAEINEGEPIIRVCSKEASLPSYSYHGISTQHGLTLSLLSLPFQTPPHRQPFREAPTGEPQTTQHM